MQLPAFLAPLRSCKLNRTTRSLILLVCAFTGVYTIFTYSYTHYSGSSFLSDLKSQFVSSNATRKLAPPIPSEVSNADPALVLGESHSPDSGFNYEFNNGTHRANATLLMLVRNSELEKAMQSVRELEEKFNRQFGYPWLFLNNVPFSKEFKEEMSKVVSGPATFAMIPPHHWYQPDWIDEDKATKSRDKMVEENIIYGGSVSYRNMCRFNSGFFYRHPLLQQYKWYWRVEPDVHFHCDVDEDPFLYMEEHNKVYGFTITLLEFEKTIATLWPTVKEFMAENPQYVAEENSMGYLSEDGGETYNLCHFWSNFEIADMDFWRGEAYSKFFDYIDAKGGFYYERWGDAPVHSIAASLFLQKDQVHFFDEIGYEHHPFTHCPHGPGMIRKKHCTCRGWRSFDYQGYSCMRKWERIHK
ncbi:glycosyltransferase family 15 protein [Laetiporus sulphureus 93-53]|uniref:Glycosyltransferase family 15 protein n=1 Tax=Laetiporus sulphureus 93-53 TaxID=1314785 RepID=A0A165C0L5_9APHY|nr:glycosyltransferase family 15 protein [Laetiporus sulphureus 93-53]KZT01984.1 glycosyltransferase family 15 protein [Laetiporus sulphureus 93-53]